MINFELRAKYIHTTFQIKEKVTLVVGDSGTMKTEFFKWLGYALDKLPGIDLICDVPCVTLQSLYWYYDIKGVENSLVFVDGPKKWLNDPEFAKTVVESSNHYVLFSRELFLHIPFHLTGTYMFDENLSLVPYSDINTDLRRKYCG